MNYAGQESGNASITNGRDLPWLQDTTEANVVASWAVTYRDLVVLDDDNEVFSVYNLTSHDLSNPDNYATLKAILLDAANP